jgi:ribosomal protein L37E
MSSTLHDSLMWRCTECGERSLNHYENCALCGCARPAPPPKQAPTSKSRPKPRRVSARKSRLADGMFVRCSGGRYLLTTP